MAITKDKPRNQEGYKINQEMSHEIGIRQGGSIKKPVFEMVVIIDPNEKCYKNGGGKKDRLVNLTVIGFYEADDFLHFRVAK
jgi:hypothetical protein